MKQFIYGTWGEENRDQLLDVFLPFLQEKKIDNCFYVVPTASLAADVRDRLLNRIPGWMGKPVLTFDDLITKIIQTSSQPYQRIDSVMQERAIHHIMQQSERQWAGKTLSKWANYPGIVRTIVQTIGELRRANVTIQELQQVADDDLKTLAVVWQQYENWLRQGAQGRFLDIEEGFLYAEELLNQHGIDQILPGLQCVIFDHFLDFNPLQKRILHHFRKIPTCLLYVPFLEQQRKYPELKRSLEQLEKMFTTPDENTFTVVRLEEEKEDQESVRIELTGLKSLEKQWLWIAKEIKRRVNSGVSLDRIAILVPDCKRHLYELDKILRLESIPHRAIVKQPLCTIPLVQEILTLLRIAAGNWQRGDVLAYAMRANLQGQYVPVHVLQRLVYKLGIQRGYQTWVSRLQTYLQTLENKPNDHDEDEFDNEFGDVDKRREKTNVRAILGWIENVQAYAEAFTDKASVPIFVQRVLEYMEVTHMRNDLMQQAAPIVRFFTKQLGHVIKENDVEAARMDLKLQHSVQVFRANMRAIDAIQIWSKQIVKIERLLRPQDDLCTIQEFLMVVETDWEGIEIDVTDAKDAGVWILEPTAARGLTFDHVFLANLNEGSFPKSEQIPWLITDDQQRDLKKHGVELPQKQLQLDLQKAFFTMALGMAKQNLELLYINGEGMLRSRFVEALLRENPSYAEAWNNRLLNTDDSYLQGSGLYPAQWQDISNQKERDLWMFANLPQTSLQKIDVNPLILAAISIETNRANGDLQRFGGVLADSEISNQLQSLFHFDRAYSASFFNQYGKCAFQFFLQRVIHVELPEQEGDILAPSDKGNLYHKVLFRLYREWKEQHDRKLTIGDSAKWLESMQRIAAEEIAQLEQATYIAERVTWQIEKERILETLTEWVGQDLQLFERMEANVQPHRFEWSFGLPLEDDDQYDPQSTAEPVEIGGLKFAGRIDRVDYAKDQDMYLIYDYKTTGRNLTGKKDLEKGIDFQLALYLHAVERNKPKLGIGEKAAAAGALYYGIEIPTRNNGLYHENHKEKIGMKLNRSHVQADAWEETLEQAIQTVSSYHESMREGDFSLSPRNCTTYCPFKNICRFDPIQQLQADLNKAAASIRKGVDGNE